MQVPEIRKAGNLSESAREAVSGYLETIGDHDVNDLYRVVVDEVERPLLEVILKHTRGNQSKAATCLGMNRATLKTKLKRHGLV